MKENEGKVTGYMFLRMALQHWFLAAVMNRQDTEYLKERI
jgi:hypothetical protein